MDATPEKPPKVMVEDMKAKMATMDDNIARLRLKGKDLAIDARVAPGT